MKSLVDHELRSILFEETGLLCGEAYDLHGQYVILLYNSENPIGSVSITFTSRGDKLTIKIFDDGLSADKFFKMWNAVKQYISTPSCIEDLCKSSKDPCLYLKYK